MACSGLNNMAELNVKLKDRTYPIHIGAGMFEKLLSDISENLAGFSKYACVVDSTVAQKYREHLDSLTSLGVESLSINGGESAKCFSNFEKLCNWFAEIGLDRKSCVIAIGGGVIGDLTGFSAASYMRGISLIQVPTTLLSMVDSSVGGKTGINISAGKNLVGAFHQPNAVYADTDFLFTLPAREFSAGMAEVVKCGVLGDEKLFNALEAFDGNFNASSVCLPDAIYSSCALKAKIVAEDEHETAKEGGRALLNLGHTLGHAIEKTAGYGAYLHGEAVAIGMVFAAYLSERFATLQSADSVRVKILLERCGLPTQMPVSADADAILNAMKSDKKTLSGTLRFVLMNGIGNAYTQAVDDTDAHKLVCQMINEVK